MRKNDSSVGGDNTLAPTLWRREISSLTIATMRRLIDVESRHERLHRAGWSIGEVGTTTS